MGIKWFKDDSPLGAVLLFLVIGVLAAILIILNIKKVGIGDTGLRLGKASSDEEDKPRKFSASAMHKIAHSYGLNSEQSKLLESIFRFEEVSNPAKVMTDQSLIDKYFKDAYKRIERASDEEEIMQKHLSLLFSIRNAIDFSHTLAESAVPPKITKDMPAILTLGGTNDGYPVRVLSVKGPSLVTECPHNAAGASVKIPRGSKINLSFFANTSKGFNMEGHVTAITNSNGAQTLQIASGKTQTLTQRRFRRRQVGLNCGYYQVNMPDTRHGAKKGAKMTVSSRQSSGSILDISVGGCAIQTSGTVKPGTYLKIEFQVTGAPSSAVLGQVLRINSGGAANTLHTKFTKVPRKAMNIINALIFEYNTD